MKMIRKLPTILLIFVALLSIGFTYAEENEDGSGDIPDSTMIPITNKTGEGEEDNTSNMTTMQIIFVTSICSILTVVLLAIITIYVCGKKKTSERCYGPVTLLHNDMANHDEDDTLYMVDYDHVAMNHSKLSITINSELNEK
ncbi:uncharacterized protein LOC120341700 [Styela clava]|uniref:uncharacterized protein LOC120341700 isoform X1 n=1 Tax=Styela clava TaxID=7725 RepID=UPI00193AA564|nr:uncharacterized protein LOC120341700 isoform X1 [Styela clava]